MARPRGGSREPTSCRAPGSGAPHAGGGRVAQGGAPFKMDSPIVNLSSIGLPEPPLGTLPDIPQIEISGPKRPRFSLLRWARALVDDLQVLAPRRSRAHRSRDRQDLDRSDREARRGHPRSLPARHRAQVHQRRRHRVRQGDPRTLVRRRPSRRHDEPAVRRAQARQPARTRQEDRTRAAARVYPRRTPADDRADPRLHGAGTSRRRALSSSSPSCKPKSRCASRSCRRPHRKCWSSSTSCWAAGSWSAAPTSPRPAAYSRWRTSWVSSIAKRKRTFSTAWPNAIPSIAKKSRTCCSSSKTSSTSTTASIQRILKEVEAKRSCARAQDRQRRSAGSASTKTCRPARPDAARRNRDPRPHAHARSRQSAATDRRRHPHARGERSNRHRSRSERRTAGLAMVSGGAPCSQSSYG